MAQKLDLVIGGHLEIRSGDYGYRTWLNRSMFYWFNGLTVCVSGIGFMGSGLRFWYECLGFRVENLRNKI